MLSRTQHAANRCYPLVSSWVKSLRGRDWGPDIPNDVMLRNVVKLAAMIAGLAMGIHLAFRVGHQGLLAMGAPPPERPISSGAGHYTPRSPWQLTEKQWEEVERMAGKKRNRSPTE